MKITKQVTKLVGICALTIVVIVGLVLHNDLVTGAGVGALAAWLTNEKNNGRED